MTSIGIELPASQPRVPSEEEKQLEALSAKRDELRALIPVHREAIQEIRYKIEALDVEAGVLRSTIRKAKLERQPSTLPVKESE